METQPEHQTTYPIAKKFGTPSAIIKIKENKQQTAIMNHEREFHIKKDVENFDKFPLNEFKQFLQQEKDLTITETQIINPKHLKNTK